MSSSPEPFMLICTDSALDTYGWVFTAALHYWWVITVALCVGSVIWIIAAAIITRDIGITIISFLMAATIGIGAICLGAISILLFWLIICVAWQLLIAIGIMAVVIIVAFSVAYLIILYQSKRTKPEQV